MIAHYYNLNEKHTSMNRRALKCTLMILLF
jgi:hypothetical protein